MSSTSKLATLAVGLAAIGLAGCGWFSSKQKVPLVAAPNVPGAEGTVTVSKDKNNNTELDIAVKHLAEPSKLGEGNTVYVAWAEPLEGGEPVRLGALAVNKDLEGEAKAVTTLTKLRVFVTAESSPEVTRPGKDVVLRTEVFDARPR